MLSPYPLTIYFDASCPLCHEEMTRLKQYDFDGNLHLIDCSASDFLPPNGAPDQREMMQILHATTAQGQWVMGVPVFQLAYAAVGFAAVANFLGNPWVSRLAARVYPLVARHRYLIPSGLARVWFKLLAIRATRRSRACANGVCKL